MILTDEMFNFPSQLNIPEGALRKDDTEHIDEVLYHWYGLSICKVFVHNENQKVQVTIQFLRTVSKNEIGDIRQFLRAQGFKERVRSFMQVGRRILIYELDKTEVQQIP